MKKNKNKIYLAIAVSIFTVILTASVSTAFEGPSGNANMNIIQNAGHIMRTLYDNTFTANKIANTSWLNGADVSASSTGSIIGRLKYIVSQFSTFDSWFTAGKLNSSALPTEGVWSISGNITLGSQSVTGASVLWNDLANSGTITSTGAFQNVVKGATITANNTGRTVTAKTSSSAITLDNTVDWSTASNFSYQNPTGFEFSDGTTQTTAGPKTYTTPPTNPNDGDYYVNNYNVLYVYVNSTIGWLQTGKMIGNFASSVSVGYNSTCAVLSDSTVKCWGNNTNGQLGNGTNTNSNVPVPVTGITTATSVSMGANSTCALLGDGTVKCWGNNYFGTLGNGTSGVGNDSNVPVPVAGGIFTAISVSMGGYSTCAVLKGGVVRCWGENTNGQLGNGTGGVGTDSNVPVDVTNMGSAIITDSNLLSNLSYR